MSRADYRKLLKATFVEDFDEVDRINADLGDTDWKDSGLLIAAVFSVAIEERFAKDSSRSAVKDFITAARADYAEADNPIKPLVAEGVVRAALGEEELLDGISAAESMQVQMILAHKIISEGEKSPAEIDALLDRAEKLLDSSV